MKKFPLSWKTIKQLLAYGTGAGLIGVSLTFIVAPKTGSWDHAYDGVSWVCCGVVSVIGTIIMVKAWDKLFR